MRGRAPKSSVRCLPCRGSTPSSSTPHKQMTRRATRWGCDWESLSINKQACRQRSLLLQAFSEPDVSAMWSRNRTASRAPGWERQTQRQQSRRKRRRARMQLPLRIRCSQMPAATWLRYDLCTVSACVSMLVSTAASKSRWIHPCVITPRCRQEVPRLRCRRELACKRAPWLTLRSIAVAFFSWGRFT